MRENADETPGGALVLPLEPGGGSDSCSHTHVRWCRRPAETPRTAVIWRDERTAPPSAVFKAAVQNSTLRASSESSQRSVSSICFTPPSPSPVSRRKDGVPYLINPSKARLSEVDRRRKLYVNQNLYLVMPACPPPSSTPPVQGRAV